MWGKQRLIFLKNHSEEEMYKTEFKIRYALFSILIIDIDIKKEKIYMNGIHSQCPEYWDTKEMDSRFAHYDKPLLILGRKIKPNEIEESGSMFPVIRNNKIENVKFGKE